MARSLVKNSADEAQVKEAERKEKFSEQNKKTDLFVLLQMPEGRRFFWETLADMGLMREVFNAHTSLMAFNAGRQSCAKQLLDKINEADESAYYKMIKEQNEEIEK